ncbi:MAG: guanylate kinase [Dehalococcoidia bacterium]
MPELELPEGPPMLTVLSGFSGSGKDAVRDLLMAWHLPVHFVVTVTNREMRPGEVEGIDYLFVSNEEFDRMERDGELIEHAIVYGQKKGVPKQQIVEPLAAGRDVLARVDVQGAATLKALVPDAYLIFIAPPSMEEAARRLTDRDTDSEEQRRIREETAQAELEASKAFDVVVINETGKLEDTVHRVAELIAAEKRRRAALDIELR